MLALSLQVLVLALLLVPGITVNTAEITKRWSGSNRLIQLEMPPTEPQCRIPQGVGLGTQSQTFSGHSGMVYAHQHPQYTPANDYGRPHFMATETLGQHPS